MKEKIKVRRVPKRGQYDKEIIYRILDRGIHCHVGFIHEHVPVVIPTAYGRAHDFIYIHGSTASRMMKNLERGIDVCVTITTVTGLVLAKSAFHHSMNYESVVIFGKAELVNDREEKIAALKSFTDHILLGRWEEVRFPNEKELKGTMVLKIKLDEVSAKIRAEGVSDDREDEPLNIWTGVLPFETKIGNPIYTHPTDSAGIPSSVNRILHTTV